MKAIKRIKRHEFQMIFKLFIEELEQFIKQKRCCDNGGPCIVTVATALKYLGATPEIVEALEQCYLKA